MVERSFHTRGSNKRSVDFTACRSSCWSGGQAGATGFGWFPHQTRPGLFGKGHPVCRSASRGRHIRSWTDGFSSGGQVVLSNARSYRYKLKSLFIYIFFLMWLGFIHTELYIWGTTQRWKATVLRSCLNLPNAQLKNILLHHQVQQKLQYIYLFCF